MAVVHNTTGNLPDVTDVRHAEEALLTLESLQTAIFNSADFASIATDAKRHPAPHHGWPGAPRAS